MFYVNSLNSTFTSTVSRNDGGSMQPQQKKSFTVFSMSAEQMDNDSINSTEEGTSKMTITSKTIRCKDKSITITPVLKVTGKIGYGAFLIGTSATLIGCTAISVVPEVMPWFVFICGSPWYISMAVKDALLLLGRETLKWSIPTMVIGGTIALSSCVALRAYRKYQESHCLTELTQYVLA